MSTSNTLVLDHLFGVPLPTTTRGQSTKLGISNDGILSYASNRSAILRSLDGSSPSRSFSSPQIVTVAKVNAAGTALAVGDSVGNLKVLDFSGDEVRTKLEVKLGGEIRDIAWDAEGQRISMVGDGREKYGAVYSLSTGSSIGEISGHSRAITAVAMRPVRPFRAITASEDASVVFLNGPPFKFNSLSRNHSRIVHSVDFSPNGTLACSAGDAVHLYDGTSGDHLRALPSIHSGSIYASTFSPDSKSLLTSSVDCSTKVVDVESGTVVKSWSFGEQAQVGNVWSKAGEIVSLSINGELTVLDQRSDKPVRVLHGHQKPITALTHALETKTFYSGDSAGLLRSWDDSTCAPLASNHSNLVIEAIHDGSKLISIGMDDDLRVKDGSDEGRSLAVGALPKGISVSSNGLLYLATSLDLQIIQTSPLAEIATLPVSSAPTSIAVGSSGKTIAVGAADGKVYLYATDGKSFNQTSILEKNRTSVTYLTFSKGEKEWLAVGEQSGKIIIYDTETLEIKSSRFVNHSARISSLAWNDDNVRLLSGSLDSSVLVFSLATPSKVISAKNAHAGGVVSVLWTSENEIASAGSDGTLKSWKLPI